MTNPFLENDDIKKAMGQVSLNDAIITAEISTEFLLVPRKVSQLRDVVWADDSRVRPANADVEFLNGKYTITTADSGSENQNAISFESLRVGQYRPGSPFFQGVYVEKDESPVGHLDFGYFRNNEEQGPRFRWNSDGSWSIRVANGGVDTVIPRNTWQGGTSREVENENSTVTGEWFGIDPMDGSGPSGIDLTDGSIDYVFGFVGAWYGGGPVMPVVLTTDGKGNYHPHPVGIFEPKNDVNFEQPNQPVTVKLDNEGGSSQDTVNVAGRQYSTAGKSNNEVRKHSHVNSGDGDDNGISIGTSYEPLLAFKRKADSKGINIRPGLIEIGTDQLLHVYAEINATIDEGATTFSDPSTVQNPSESVIEVADPSDIVGAVRGDGASYNGLFYGSAQKNQARLEESEGFSFPVGREDVVILWARSLTGNSATVQSNVNLEESS